MKVLVDLGTDIVHTLFDVTFKDMDRSNEHIQKFDEILNQIIKMCDKQSSRIAKGEQEDLWKHALRSIFSIKDKVFALISNGLDSDSDADAGTEEKENFRRFLNARHQKFIQQMSEYVNLHRVVSYLEEEGHVMEFKEFKTTFEDKVRQESLTENVLLTALKLQMRDMQHDSKILSQYLQKGVINTSNKCDFCHVRFNVKWDKQEVWCFKCDHSFHTSCIQASQGQCAVCFNELEAFCKYIALVEQLLSLLVDPNIIFVFSDIRVNHVNEEAVKCGEASPSQECVAIHHQQQRRQCQRDSIHSDCRARRVRQAEGAAVRLPAAEQGIRGGAGAKLRLTGGAALSHDERVREDVRSRSACVRRLRSLKIHIKFHHFQQFLKRSLT